MRSYEASATIEATPDAVWKILVDGRLTTPTGTRG